MLIQLDKNVRPTSVIVFRDISDSILIESIASSIGETKTLKADLRAGVRNGTSIEPDWWNSAWHFDEAGVDAIPNSNLKTWGLAHDTAYKNELAGYRKRQILKNKTQELIRHADIPNFYSILKYLLIAHVERPVEL